MIDILIYLLMYVLGIFTVIILLNIFSSTMFVHLQDSVNEQISISKKILERHQVEQKQQIDLISQIAQNHSTNFLQDSKRIDDKLAKINQKLGVLENNIEDLGYVIDQRKELENEIIKLKNIMKRRKNAEQKNN